MLFYGWVGGPNMLSLFIQCVMQEKNVHEPKLHGVRLKDLATFRSEAA